MSRKTEGRGKQYPRTLFFPCLFAPCFGSSRWSGRLVMLVPGIGEAADGFAQAHGQPRNGFQSFDGGGRQPVAPREQKFGISENSGQGIVHFVAENFAEVPR